MISSRYNSSSVHKHLQWTDVVIIVSTNALAAEGAKMLAWCFRELNMIVLCKQH